jgi:isopenicillin-N N-acyltransferase-like protein
LYSLVPYILSTSFKGNYGECALEKVFPFFEFSGTHYQMGQQYGSACGDMIKQNLALSMQRLQNHTNASRAQILQATLEYRPFVVKYSPFLDDEINGIADSTGLLLEEIYFLQLRAEIQTQFASSFSGNPEMECTTFALSPAGTKDRIPLAGQNADLPSFYADICIVVQLRSPEHPAVLMITPAGQISYIGINKSGLCAFANYLVCDGWRLGYPRYCLTRLALTQKNTGDAERLLLGVHRASSRNLLLNDSQGAILDLEFAVQSHGRLATTEGYFVHSNHFISPDMYGEERTSAEDLFNSQQRRSRLQHLIADEFGKLDPDKLKYFLRDRETYPDPVCIEPGDKQEGDEITVASVIAEPVNGNLWAAVGPPSWNPYNRYSFTCM